MAVITGVTGAVSFSGGIGAGVLNATEWSGSSDSDLYDSTTFDTSTAGKDTESGMYVWRFTVTGFLDDTTSFPTPETSLAPGTVVTFTLTANTGKTYSGTGKIANLSPRVTKAQGLNSYTTVLQSSGAVVIA